MRIGVAIFLSLISVSGTAHAEASCDALLTKIGNGFQVAHQMNPANHTAKCRAYAMVTLDADDIAAKCREQSDMAMINARYVPVAKALAADEEAYCAGH